MRGRVELENGQLGVGECEQDPVARSTQGRGQGSHGLYLRVELESGDQVELCGRNAIKGASFGRRRLLPTDGWWRGWRDLLVQRVQLQHNSPCHDKVCER